MAKRIDDGHEQKPANGQSPWSPKKHKDPHPKDMQCVKQSGLLRCALPATWFPNNGTRGYCWLHDDESRHLTGPDLHAQLEDIRGHRQRYINERESEDWRRVLVDDVIEAHPEWHRGENEGKREYAKRMLKTAKALGKGLRSRQHVIQETERG